MSASYTPHYHWAIMLAVSLGFFSWQWVAPRYGGLASLLFGYLSLSAIWVWVWVENRYVTVNPYDQMALRYFAADSLARLLALLFPLMMLAERRHNFLLFGELLAGIFVNINSLSILYTFVRTGCHETNQCGGLGNPSIMVGLMVCLLPIVIRSWKAQRVTLGLAVAAVLLSKSSVALGLLGLYLLYSFVRKFPRYKYAGLLLPALPLLAGALLLGKQELFNSSDRFALWAYMMPKWATPWNLAMGTGWGTYHVFSINLQSIQGFAPGSYWNTLHNDWLQMIFEGGLVGAFLLALTYLFSVWRMVEAKEWGFVASLILFGIYMGVNPALHHAIPSLFGAWIFLYALKRRQNNYEGEALCSR
jgi:hypothetical protein